MILNCTVKTQVDISIRFITFANWLLNVCLKMLDWSRANWPETFAKRPLAKRLVGRLRARVKITPREKRWHTAPFLAWGDFHARSRVARSTIPEEKWGTTRSLTRWRNDRLPFLTSTFADLTHIFVWDGEDLGTTARKISYPVSSLTPHHVFKMAEHDLTARMGCFLDRHLVFPLLEFLSVKEVNTFLNYCFPFFRIFGV